METSVQPAGAVAVGLDRTSITATITLPNDTVAGLVIVRFEAVALAPVEDDRNRMSAVSRTVQVNVSVSATVRPPFSLTVMLTEYGLFVTALLPIVPVISPVEELIDRPPGRPVAAYVSVSPSMSVAAAESEIGLFSSLVRSARFWLNVGGRLVLVTVQVNVSVAPVVTPLSSLTVTLTLKGLVAAAV